MKKLIFLFTLILSINVFGQSPYQVTRIITDFGGYWSTKIHTDSINLTKPDNSHNLLGFKYNGRIYSTGVNDDTLTNRGIPFNAGNFKALPVQLIGTTKGTDNLIIAGSKKDGNLTSAIWNTPPISEMTMQSVVMDGIRGLDLGTGYTNLKTDVNMTYNISILVESKISDSEPDILITQIAQPSGNFDTYTFLDINGVKVGNSITFSMNSVDKLGTYRLDLFTVASGQNLEDGVPNGVWTPIGTNDVRDIRLAALRLSDFGLNYTNYNSVRKLKITPSGTSDIAFIGYNANAIKALPSITRKSPTTDTIVCLEGDAATLAVNVTSSYADVLTYQWQKKIGSDWIDLTNTTKYVGVSTKTLTINYDSDTTVDFSLEKYRIKVVSANAEDSSYSTQFKISLQSSSCFLPITLSYFEVNCGDIKWETSSEYNTKDFILFGSNVEHPLFPEDWNSLTTIDAAVNSNELLTYEYNLKNQFMYYLLKQNDINGNFEYFGPYIDKCDKGIEDEHLNVCRSYPNPVSDVINVICDGNISEVNIYTLEGKKITEKNTFDKEIEFNIIGLKPSIYFYVVTMENGNIINGKFIKK